MRTELQERREQLLECARRFRSAGLRETRKQKNRAITQAGASAAKVLRLAVEAGLRLPFDDSAFPDDGFPASRGYVRVIRRPGLPDDEVPPKALTPECEWYALWLRLCLSLQQRFRAGLPADLPVENLLSIDVAKVPTGSWAGISGDAEDLAQNFAIVCEWLASQDAANGVHGDCDDEGAPVDSGQADRKADKKRIAGKKLPSNTQVLQLLRLLDLKRNAGRQKIEIARELTDGDDDRAKTLLRQVRRFLQPTQGGQRTADKRTGQ